MNSNMNSLLAEQHQPDRTRTISHDRHGRSDPLTRGHGAPTRWTSLAHGALNQAKMAAPRRASASSSSSVPAAPDRATIVDRTAGSRFDAGGSSTFSRSMSRTSPSGSGRCS
jgi:uncharacterized membrane protein YgcG